MSDDEEMESFDINEEDLNRAYNPGAKRNKMSKEQAMLGIWASNDYSDDDDEDEFSYKNQKKKFPIGFVSGSKKAPNSKSKQKENDYSDEDGDTNKNNQDDSDFDDYDEKFESKKSKKEVNIFNL